MVSRAKAALRKKILEMRDSLTQDEISSKSRAIMKTLFSMPRFKEAKVVAFYLPKGSEVDAGMMVKEALRLGKEVVVPVTDHKITFYKFKSFDDLKKGKYGILEPKTREKPSKPPDIILIPGTCFGLCMHRVGYGKGYYDDYLGKSFSYRIGLCFDFQLVEKLPTHENDQRMDEIITEKRIIT
jgi:5-formyltetrahydrofolate cyclo-ligase